MSEPSTDFVWVGVDVHQDSVTVAILVGDDHEPRVERLPGDLNAVLRLFRRLSRQGTPRSCYEASGAGYVLQRALEHDGFHCEVIAPSLIPRRPGDRRKTDRLDAVHLVHHDRAGNLVPVTVPSREQEEIRQLVRSRLAVQSHVVRLKHRIVRVLATHGHRFVGGKSNQGAASAEADILEDRGTQARLYCGNGDGQGTVRIRLVGADGPSARGLGRRGSGTRNGRSSIAVCGNQPAFLDRGRPGRRIWSAVTNPRISV